MYATRATRRFRRVLRAAAVGAGIWPREARTALASAGAIALPFSVAVFREVSVIDRPGDWGPRFDQVIARARVHSDLVELDFTKNDQRAFLEANHEIVARVTAANAGEKFAIVVWDGAKRGEGDATADLADEARQVGLEVIEVLTVDHIR